MESVTENRSSFGVFALTIRIGILIALCWLGSESGARAVPPPPCVFFGAVSVNGEDVPAGTPISAWIGGQKVAEEPSLIYLGRSYYRLSVPGDDPLDPLDQYGGKPGDTIYFRVGDLPAAQTAMWQEAGTQELNLTASGACTAWYGYLPIIIR